MQWWWTEPAPASFSPDRLGSPLQAKPRQPWGWLPAPRPRGGRATRGNPVMCPVGQRRERVIAAGQAARACRVEGHAATSQGSRFVAVDAQVRASVDLPRLGLGSAVAGLAQWVDVGSSSQADEQGSRVRGGEGAVEAGEPLGSFATADGLLAGVSHHPHLPFAPAVVERVEATRVRAQRGGPTPRGGSPGGGGGRGGGPPPGGGGGGGGGAPSGGRPAGGGAARCAVGGADGTPHRCGVAGRADGRARRPDCRRTLAGPTHGWRRHVRRARV